MARGKRQTRYLQALKKEGAYERLVDQWGSEECWICGSTPKTRRLHVDHNHVPEQYERGLLCFNCNKRLDDRVTAKWLRDAADYLDAAKERYSQMIKEKRAA